MKSLSPLLGGETLALGKAKRKKTQDLYSMVLMAIKFSSPGRLISSQDLFCGDGEMEGEERCNREGEGFFSISSVHYSLVMSFAADK